MADSAAGAPKLKDSFGSDIPRRLAAGLVAIDPAFDAPGFVEWVLADYDDLELMPRARRIAEGLALYLPEDRERAIDLLRVSLPPLEATAAWRGMDAFLLLPHAVYVGRYGLDCFEASMALQYEITKRFTAEFSIREFIAHRYQPTMDRLAEWARDDDARVRRLVSEGTRSRLPWAPRLRRFQEDPTPVLPLLEALQDDPSPDVRRSVANNLNDIGKDHPDVLLAVASRWAVGASPERLALLRHALRSLVKAGDPEALAVLGFRAAPGVRVTECVLQPRKPRIGEKVRVSVTLLNDTDAPVRVAVDLGVDFVKSRGGTGRKVFKGAELELAPGVPVRVNRTISVAQQSTRTHYAGEHHVWVLVNGVAHDGGSFGLTE